MVENGRANDQLIMRLLGEPTPSYNYFPFYLDCQVKRHSRLLSMQKRDVILDIWSSTFLSKGKSKKIFPWMQSLCTQTHYGQATIEQS